jgi:hypothetical protein
MDAAGVPTTIQLSAATEDCDGNASDQSNEQDHREVSAAAGGPWGREPVPGKGGGCVPSG